jgi:inhibitor of KinA
MKIIPASDSSLLVEFGTTISPEIHDRVVALFRALQSKPDPRITNLHPGYASVLVDFDPLRCDHDEMTAILLSLSDQPITSQAASANMITIPVCYDTEFGPDLADVAVHNRISVEEVARLHSSVTYLVYFLGFSPGFAYLGGLLSELHTPRLATPRQRVTAGSVGIAGSQTGVYPIDSPGGWRIIGRTPLRMFDPDATPPTRLQPGDRVTFSPIDRDVFLRHQSTID